MASCSMSVSWRRGGRGGERGKEERGGEGEGVQVGEGEGGRGEEGKRERGEGSNNDESIRAADNVHVVICNLDNT